MSQIMHLDHLHILLGLVKVMVMVRASVGQMGMDMVMGEEVGMVMGLEQE